MLTVLFFLFTRTDYNVTIRILSDMRGIHLKGRSPSHNTLSSHYGIADDYFYSL